MPILQKQVGCLNHRAIALVADKLARETVVMTLVLKTNCIRQPKRLLCCPVPLKLTTLQPSEYLKVVITNALQSCSEKLSCKQVIPSGMF